MQFFLGSLNCIRSSSIYPKILRQMTLWMTQSDIHSSPIVLERLTVRIYRLQLKAGINGKLPGAVGKVYYY